MANVHIGSQRVSGLSFPRISLKGSEIARERNPGSGSRNGAPLL
jgi:hypothetical protein